MGTFTKLDKRLGKLQCYVYSEIHEIRKELDRLREIVKGEFNETHVKHKRRNIDEVYKKVKDAIERLRFRYY